MGYTVGVESTNMFEDMTASEPCYVRVGNVILIVQIANLGLREHKGLVKVTQLSHDRAGTCHGLSSCKAVFKMDGRC